MNEGDTQEKFSENNNTGRQSIDAEQIKNLRDRLYARGDDLHGIVRHSLVPRSKPNEVPAAESKPVVEEPVPATPEPVNAEPVASVPNTQLESAVSYNNMTTTRRKSLRKKIILIGLFFFVVATAISSFIMFSGTNTISGENISLAASGPISVGGGDDYKFQVSVANQNTVAIQSATLIIEYPKGSQGSADGKELTIERKQLDTVNAGELINIPLSARMYGEENEEKEIKVSIDYRVSGSNAIFKKEATPLRFKVSTSPVVMTFDTLKTISSGQNIELKLTIQSNSPTPLTDILVKTMYPQGFDFTKSSPETSSGEDMWRIATLNPGEKKVITINGLMTGYENDVRKFNARAGVANASDKNALASVLAETEEEIVIEQSFIQVGVSVNGTSDNEVIVDSNGIAIVTINFGNTLDSTIYDGTITVALSGNGLSEFDVSPTDGFYDSTKNTITWDGTSDSKLSEILPGRTSNVSFTLDPNADAGETPEIKLAVTVGGKRVFESGVPEVISGVAERTIRIESVPVLSASALHSNGLFVNTGPTPPVAEEVTQYTFSLEAQAGTNSLANAEVTAVLPQYVTWLDLVSEGDTVTYNATNRTIKWTIGNMDAHSTQGVAVQVSFLPSLTQVGSTPTILEAQRFKATDRFTGTIVRAEHPALTTSLYDEPDTALHDGKVRKSGE